jgi:hypothetical protein
MMYITVMEMGLHSRLMLFAFYTLTFLVLVRSESVHGHRIQAYHGLNPRFSKRRCN